MKITEKRLLQHCKQLYRQGGNIGFWFLLGSTIEQAYENHLKYRLYQIKDTEKWTTGLLACADFGEFRITVDKLKNEVVVLEQW